MMVFLAFFFLLSLTNVVRSIPTDLDQNSQAIPEPAEEPSGNAPDGVLGFLSVASNPTDPTPDRVNIPTDPLNLGFNPPGGYISSAGDSSTTDSDGAGFKTPLVDTSWIADDPVLRPLADKVENCHSSSKQKREEATGYCPSGITQPTRGSSSQRPRNQDPPLRNGAVLSHRGTPKCNNGWTPSCCYNGIVRPISDGKGGIKFDYGICTKCKLGIFDPLLSNVAAIFPRLGH